MLSKKLAYTLEVERKFVGLAVPDLTRNTGLPPFHSIRYLGQNTFTDTYYDRRKLLANAGVWVRQRNRRWEAKVKQGGDFINSRFEETYDHSAIARYVAASTGLSRSKEDNFGLERIASLRTVRHAWVADSHFKIVLDSTDFGHVVGEIELQQDISLDGDRPEFLERQKEVVMEEMDTKIAEFMDRYRWAFRSGKPKGKLTAYFERYPLPSSS